ncbi:MAG: hypothetical protein ABSC05_08725 [Candidatus Solibacter sp.]|jgi:hypothetical protein
MEKDHAISRREWMTWTAGSALAIPLFGQGHPEVMPLPAGPHVPWTEHSAFRRVTLEMSLKPFRRVDSAGIRSVCEHVFRQWAPLLARADGCAVMLWTADGSEILNYRGRMSDEIEWARYIGIVNPTRVPPKADPSNISIHQQARFYMENPPRITYGTLREIVQTFQSVGRSMTGKPVAVGATFDPGPEFARSPFKYEKHPEILKGNWVDCSATLNGDTEPYAGFPRGIPSGTPFGTFFGRQVQRFLTDLGFEYIWFSNGFGFSATAWSVKGPLFDGETFHPEKAGEIREKILAFWKTFRAACPAFPVECRGSNLSTGADLSASASPVRDIYDGGFHMVAPPNSPWAAIDGDFGLEISGYLSHIAHLPPGDVFPFRFYTHDPWWMNSPWFDRYGREPHDIYMPLALARLNAQGKVTPPSFLEFLTIDNSFGELPDQCPNEVTPHILSAMDHFSDAAGLLTWVYPFQEFHEKVFGNAPRPAEVFFSDWFIRNAVNAGLPLNTVVSTTNFLASQNTNPSVYRDTVLLTPVPDPGSPLESALLQHLDSGGDVFLYGPATHAGPKLLGLLNLNIASPLTGELELRSLLAGDTVRHGRPASRMLHRDAPSGGGIDTAAAQPAAAGIEICATVSDGSNERVFALMRRVGSGRLAWVRGSFSSRITGAALPLPDDPNTLFQAEYLMRYMLARFGYELHVEKPTLETRNPLMLVARSNNGFFFSGYCPSTAALLHLHFPHGAPILLGYETWLENGRAGYSMPRAWHRECRCFVEQKEESEISCVEGTAEEIGIRRRFLLKGLKRATVHFYPEVRPAGAPTRMENNNRRITYSAEESGRRLVASDLTGNLLISW